MTGQVILASSVPRPFARLARGRSVVHITTASNALDDRDEIVAAANRLLDQSGATWTELDIAAVSPSEATDAIDATDAVLVNGGDPYLLLDATRRSEIGPAISRLLDRGGIYCGISAGAMIAAPSLDPLVHFSPFPSPPGGSDLSGLALVDLLVMPHTDREGRRAKHEATLVNCGRAHRLVALNDGESVVVGETGWSLEVHPGLVLRPGRPDDARAISELVVESGRIGWASFLSQEQLDGIVPDPVTWIGRIESAGPDDVTVAVDGEGVAGFIWVRDAEQADLTDPVGEIATFYTHPRVWGSGVGRRLMAHGLDRLRAMGYHECVLWTEERNERPRRIYAEGGWALDGTTRTRDFHGFPITELRHRYRL